MGTTTASRTLPRRHRQERSSRHQELCQETKTATTGLAATTAVTPVDNVQEKNLRPVLPCVLDFQPGCLVPAWLAVPRDVLQRSDPFNPSLNSWLKVPVFTNSSIKAE